MQLDVFPEYRDYSNDEVLLGLSGGINSMAVLCWLALAPKELAPKVLHLYYSHLTEHSPDTFRFVAAGVRYARSNFSAVKFRMHRTSALKYFDQQKIIPLPMISPCTKALKLNQMFQYMADNQITENVVGYVKGEASRRVERMAKRTGSKSDNVIVKGVTVKFPISSQTNEWCFQIVKKHIGWYPAIYDIRDPYGKRIFKHNNCLPCKNMDVADLKRVGQYFPEYMEKAIQLSEKLKRHWGRNADAYYTEFGREEWEVKECEHCAF